MLNQNAAQRVICKEELLWFLLQQSEPRAQSALSLDAIVFAVYDVDTRVIGGVVTKRSDPIEDAARMAAHSLLRTLEVDDLVEVIQPSDLMAKHPMLFYASQAADLFPVPNAWAEGVEAFYAGQAVDQNPYPHFLQIHDDWAKGHANATSWAAAGIPAAGTAQLPPSLQEI